MRLDTIMFGLVVGVVAIEAARMLFGSVWRWWELRTIRQDIADLRVEVLAQRVVPRDEDRVHRVLRGV